MLNIDEEAREYFLGKLSGTQVVRVFFGGFG